MMMKYILIFLFICACISCVRVEPSNGRVLCDDAAYTPLYMDENSNDANPTLIFFEML